MSEEIEPHVLQRSARDLLLRIIPYVLEHLRYGLGYLDSPEISHLVGSVRGIPSDLPLFVTNSHVAAARYDVKQRLGRGAYGIVRA